MPGRIMIVDDDVAFAKVLARALGTAGHDVIACNTAAEARVQIAANDPDVVVLDYQLPDADGLALLEELQKTAAGAVYLMATAYPDLNVAVEAMRRGAFDYLAKGGELRECTIRIERGAEVARLRRRLHEDSHSAQPRMESASATSAESFPGLLGESPAMRQLAQRLSALSGKGADDTTVFLVGETGTGKGVIARAIHAQSSRRYEPFVAVDCTTIPATLVESELFGHERGAFTGSVASKLGRVEAAGRGTLFLDEIGELDLQTQAKLLRLLEEREFTRVGSTKTRKLEARIITATNRDLEKMVAEGRFRADLRFRLEVFVVAVPALRDRGDDVFLLTAHFAALRARALGRREPRLHPDVIKMLPRYSWPGNVRELRNVVDQAVLLAKSDEITLEELPILAKNTSASVQVHVPVPGISAASSLSAIRPRRASAPTALNAIREAAAEKERQALADALNATHGNVSRAAQMLGMSRFQMLRRLAKYGMR